MDGRIRRSRARDLVFKPCPFCGQVPDINKHFMDGMWSLTHQCRVLGHIRFDWTKDKAGLYARWNTRHEGNSR